jgi:hypothetical protein
VAGDTEFQPPSSEKKDVFDKLERLAKLHDKGVLSHEEFEVQRKRVLSSG